MMLHHDGPIRGTRKEKEDALFERILAESQDAKKRSRQRGRLRVRPGPGRPTEASTTSPLPALDLPQQHRGGAGDESQRLSASTGALPTMSKSGSGKLAPLPANNSLDAEIPTRRQMLTEQASKLKVELKDMRTRLSKTKNAMRLKEKECKKLENELEFMKNEDNVLAQRQEGLKLMEEQKGELQRLELKLLETQEYNKTLVFMEKRLQKQILTGSSTMHKYEEALKLTRQEAEDTQKLLFEVRKDKEGEEHELARLQDEAQKQRIELEDKLEFRRQQAVEAQAAVQALEQEGGVDSSSGGESKLSDAKADAETVKPRAPHESVEVVRQLADVKRQFRDIYDAAGVAALELSADPILTRYQEVQLETERLDHQLQELRDQVEFLHESETELRRRAEPRSSDRRPSRVLGRDSFDALSTDHDDARRVLTTAREEYEQAMATKVQLEQSLDALLSRLSKFVVLSSEVDAAVASDDSFASEAVRKVNDVSGRLQYLMAAVGDELASSSTQRPLTRPGGTASGPRTTESPRPVGQTLKRSRSVASLSSLSVKEKESEIATMKEELMATMEGVVLKNEYNVRIRTDSAASSGPISSKQINSAVEAFNLTQSKLMASSHTRRRATLSDSKSGLAAAGSASAPALGVAAGSGGPKTPIESPTHRILAEAGLPVPSDGGKDPSSLTLEASRRRRRDSRESIQEALGASNLPSSHDTGAPIPGASRRNKSRTTQLAKVTAHAMAMTGEDLDDLIAQTTKDPEIVPTRGMVKHKSRVAIQRAKNTRKRAGGDGDA